MDSKVFLEKWPRSLRLRHLESAILSLSGWRKVFARDGEAESRSPDLKELDREWVLTAGFCIGYFFLKQPGEKKVRPRRLVLARDSRPTGPVLVRILQQAWQALGIEVEDLGITSLPQTLAYVKKSGTGLGFVYVSASHNPCGYNGLKIGGHLGRMLESEESHSLIADFKAAWADDGTFLAWRQRWEETPWQRGKKSESEILYQQSSRYYRESMDEVVGGPGDRERRRRMIEALSQKLKGAGIKIACDYNGSARIRSADEVYLKSYGIAVSSINKDLGSFFHAILPEGQALDALLNFMETSEENFLLGYVPDCDGDRGNLALRHPGGRVVALDAQTTFALAVISELTFVHVFYPEMTKKLAVIGNDPTSLRVSRICRSFGASFFRAEVGETNVLALAKKKQKEGFHVCLAGEGSNGGNLTPPSTVRDPLCTLMGLFKLLFLETPQGDSLLSLACQKLDLPIPGAERSPQEALWALQQGIQWYATTPMSDPEAILRTPIYDQKKFKARYERIFADAFLKIKAEWKRRYGFHAYRIFNYEGATCRIGAGNRTGDEDGGWQAVFYDKQGEVAGFVWMRGSKTEPIFRLAVEAPGGRDGEREIKRWHRSLVEAAGSEQTTLERERKIRQKDELLDTENRSGK